MAGRSARNVGVGLMVGGAALVLLSVILVDQAVRAVDQQAAQLDPSQSRLEQTGTNGAIAALAGGFGLLVFLVGVIVLAVGTRSANRDGSIVAQPSGALAWVSAAVVVGALLFAFVLPQGPLALAVALSSGGGGSAGATHVETHEGTLTGTGAVPGGSNEDVYVIHPVAPDGAIRMTFGSGGAAPDAFAIGTIEAQDGASWRLVAEARGANQTIDVARAHYPGDLRVRVHLDPMAVGQVKYGFGISYAPRG